MLRNFVENLEDYHKTSEKLGHGTFGQVIVVIKNNQKYAAKISKIDINQNSTKYFFDEIEIGSKIRYPTVLGFIGFSLTDFNKKHHTVIITEYLPNKTLRNFFNDIQNMEYYSNELSSNDNLNDLEENENLNDLRENENLNGLQENENLNGLQENENLNDFQTKKYIILMGIVKGMKYLHSNNIIHRDLKPQNIFLDIDFYPRIGDFGYARYTNKDLATFIMSSNAGTDIYNAPEIRNLEKYDFKVDIYSFSLILFEMITGEKNYNINLIDGEENKAFIERCHSKDSKQRPTFDEIEEYIKKDNFKSLFGKLNEKKVIKFEKWINRKNEEAIVSYNSSDNSINNNDNDNDNNNNNDNDNDNDNDDDSDDEIDIKDSITARGGNKIIYKLSKIKTNANIIESKEVKGDICINSFHDYKSKHYKIDRICDKAFKDSKIKSLSFSDDSYVKFIGNNVFQNSKINKLIIPASLLKVDNDWIKDANNLTRIKVAPNCALFSVVRDFLIFNNSDKFEVLFAPKNFNGNYSVDVETIKIGNYCFTNVKGLLSLNSNALSLQIIGSHAFYKCDELNRITINQCKNLTIGNFGFAENAKLSIVEISCDNIDIGANCFDNDKKLQNVIFKITNKIDIKSNAFNGCKKLSHFALNDAKEIIVGNECFKNLKRLKSFGLIADNIILGENYIQNCELLSYVLIQSKQNITILEDTFKNCPRLNSVTLKTLSDLKLNNKCFKQKEKLETVVLSGKNIDIGDESFSNCKSLTKFNIEKSGNIKIGSNQFQDCQKLINLFIESTYNFENNYQIEFGNKCFAGLGNLKEFQITGGNVVINNECLKSCKSLENLIFLNTKNLSIDSKHFSNSSSLKNLIIESDSKVEINNECFYAASEIKSVSIIGKNILISDNCFEKCSSLSFLVINADNIEFGSRALFKCDILYEISFNVNSDILIGDNCFDGLNIKDIFLSGQKITIGNECFKNCLLLESVSIPESKNVHLGSESFEECTNLTNVKINADTELKIGKSCFSNDKKLQIVDFNSKIITFGKNCFNNCQKLEKFSAPDNNETSIYYYKNSFNGTPKNIFKNKNAKINEESKENLCIIC